MDYYNKYVKYKTKYLELKYDIQYGGGVVSCDKGYTNALETCWAVGLQMILSSGHLTSDQLNEIMKSFQKGDGSVIAIKENIELFIEQQIKQIQDNTELTNAFAHYNIFTRDKIVIVKDILRTFIERYYNKFMDIQFTTKPLGYIDPETNKDRCEYRIAFSFQNLFDYIRRTTTFGESIAGQYLFCNLLSIFLLDYKVSFTNYYDNFNTINFKRATDLGILVRISGHVCCLFICNDEEKFYNDNDNKIYNCKWKDILDQGTAGKQLYIIKGCLEFIDDIKTYKDDTQISKVFSLTVISKYTEDTENIPLDIDIKRLLEFKELDDIKDRQIQTLVGDYYYNTTHNLDQALKFYELAAKQGYYLSQYNLGTMLYNGEGGIKNITHAREMFELAAEQNYADAQYKLGAMFYNNGEGSKKNITHARKMFELAAEQNHADAQYMLGVMFYKGEGGIKNIIQARKMFELAAERNHAAALYMLGIMFYYGEGGYKDIDQARIKLELAAKQGHETAAFKLDVMF